LKSIPVSQLFDYFQSNAIPQPVGINWNQGESINIAQIGIGHSMENLSGFIKGISRHIPFSAKPIMVNEPYPHIRLPASTGKRMIAITMR
jgi:hypothetical protein